MVHRWPFPGDHGGYLPEHRQTQAHEEHLQGRRGVTQAIYMYTRSILDVTKKRAAKMHKKYQQVEK